VLSQTNASFGSSPREGNTPAPTPPTSDGFPNMAAGSPFDQSSEGTHQPSAGSGRAPQPVNPFLDPSNPFAQPAASTASTLQPLLLLFPHEAFSVCALHWPLFLCSSAGLDR
jgi:hypothetical protein